MKRQITIVMLIGLVASLLLACPADPTNNGNNGKTNGNEEEGKTDPDANNFKPHVDYPDCNEDKIDDRKQTFTPKSRDELFAILDYQKGHEDKGWMVNSIDVSKVNLAAEVEVIEGDESDIDVINWLFKGKKEFNQDVSNWDTSKVSNMSGMFFGAEFFNQDVSHWVISSVTDMTSMFVYAFSFDQDLSRWDVTGIPTVNMLNATPMENKAEWHPQGCRCGSTGCQEYRGYTVDEEGNVIE